MKFAYDVTVKRHELHDKPLQCEVLSAVPDGERVRLMLLCEDGQLYEKELPLTHLRLRDEVSIHV